MKNKVTNTKPIRSEYRVVELKFDKAEVPKFREVTGKNYIEFGVNNDYPKYLLSLYNESAKHGAIVKGKCNYIYGKGFSANGKINSLDETWNDVLKKCIKDDELFRGFYLQIIWNKGQKISDIYHIDFTRVRVSKNLDSFYVKQNWESITEKPREYPAFNPNQRVGTQILYVREYNPFSEYYPLPVYYQGLNYIESDIEVSRHILGNARKGFVASTLINLNNGDPINEEHKDSVEKGLMKKFGGHDGQRIVIMFNKSKDNSASIETLGNSVLTKEDFGNINGLIQQEIFACHQITSPVLFGIKTDGQLGARNEIRDAYEIFSNTYVNERQQEMEKVFSKLTEYVGEKVELKITPVEPLKYELSENTIVENLTKNEIREMMGKPPIEDESANKTGGQTPTQNAAMVSLNDNLKNLTGRQYQNVMRIVREFSKGKINKIQARLLLSSGYGLDEGDIDTFLGIEENISQEDLAFLSQEEDKLFFEFTKCGTKLNEYNVISSNYYSESFNEDNLNNLEKNILIILEVITALQKNKYETAEAISKSLDADVDLVRKSLIAVKDAGIINTEKGKDKSIVNSVISKILSVDESTIGSVVGNINTNKSIKKDDKPNDTEDAVVKEVNEYSIRYTYEWRVPTSQQNKDTSRPFCVKMMELSASKENPDGKTWSMADIQNISSRMGYSVLDRCGGYWTQPDGSREPQCRHEWVANIVTKKKK